MAKKLLFHCALLLAFGSCEEYLSVKPDKQLAVPNTGEDLQALLDNVSVMNYGYSGLGEVASDNLFVADAIWNSITIEEERLPYIWGKIPVMLHYWTNGYNRVFFSNVVADNVDNVKYASTAQRDAVLGRALFFRGYTFFDLAQHFSAAYDPSVSRSRLGIVLRLESETTVASARASLEETYMQIENDLLSASQLLPAAKTAYPTQPNKAAAYGALARFYLSVQRYADAAKYADSCIMLQSALIDYNTVTADMPYPFEAFNEEIVFFSAMSSDYVLPENRSRIDTVLFASYADTDLRKRLFFTRQPDGYFSFTGDYARSAGGIKFNGITTAEMLLIHAESNARIGETERAKASIQTLMDHRYSGPTTDELERLSAEELLMKILSERRKELVFRGQRWMDIRRLAAAGESSISVMRIIDGRTFEITPQELKDFAFHIPALIIERAGIEQND
jgi:SusD family.